jgi:DNA-binding IclR family transcriptional regulator
MTGIGRHITMQYGVLLYRYFTHSQGGWSMSVQDPAVRENPLFVNSLAKGMTVLRAFSGAGRYLSLAEIAQRSGLDKSTAQRMSHTLFELGYLEKCPETRRYSLGRQLLDFSFQYVRTHPLVEVATPHLIELRRACEERVDLSLFDRDTLVYVVRLQSKREKFYTTLVGRRMPVFCSAGGRAMLACLPEDEARQIIEASPRKALTPQSITDVPTIMEMIATARRDGYAMAVEESILGEVAMAAAVRDLDGSPLGAVHIAASIREWEPEKFRTQMLSGLLQTVDALNRRTLG